MPSLHYADNRLGRVFSQTTTPLGLAIPIYTSVTPLGNVIWNPQGSFVLVELVSYDAAHASGTPAVFTAGLMVRRDTSAGTSIFSAFAATTPDNGYLFAGTASKVQSSNAGTVTASAGAAGDFKRMFALAANAVTDATAASQPSIHHEFNGTIILPPGTACYVAATLASVALYGQTIVWKEIPITSP
jgi:hypothetical protein